MNCLKRQSRTVFWAAFFAVIWLCIRIGDGAEPQASVVKPRLILDCDTANEIDDLYAITRLKREK